MPEPFEKVTELENMLAGDRTCGRFNIYFLGSYFPKGTGLEDREDSVQVLQLKSNRTLGVRYYAEKIRTVLGGFVQGSKLVAVVPSTLGSVTAGTKLRKLFGEFPGIEDLSDCLVRHTAIPARHLAPGPRNIKVHMDSIGTAHDEHIRGNDILLVDDVVTSGVTMQASRHYLLKAGARSVTCLALTRTMRFDPHPVAPNPLSHPPFNPPPF